MFKLVASLALIAGVLTGCASAPPLNTPSGRPEVFIAGARPQQVIDTVIARAAAKGSRIKAVTAYSVTMARTQENMMVALAYGSRYDRFPESRATITVVGTPTGTTAYAAMEMVTNPGSAFERANDITDVAGGALQELLVDISATIRANR